jgi:hypothetical protein
MRVKGQVLRAERLEFRILDFGLNVSLKVYRC